MKLIILMLLFVTPTFADSAGQFPQVCTQVYGAAADVAAAAASRDSKAVTAFRNALPSRSSITQLPADEAELLRSLYDIVDEAFGDLPIDRLTYPVYRAEICVRRLGDKPVPDSFKAVQPKLLECAKKPKEDAIPCAMEVAGSSRENDA